MLELKISKACLQMGMSLCFSLVVALARLVLWHHLQPLLYGFALFVPWAEISAAAPPRRHRCGAEVIYVAPR